jgi:uncharacterized protein YecE (DUF72 family)
MKNNQRKTGIIRIGTSNIVVPGNKLSFPLEFQLKSRLNYYSSLFNTLEVNSSFYKVPMHATFEKWSQDVPANFQFSVKLWKEITHCKNLIADLDHVDKFLKAAAGMGNKKGCLLIQFPGKITMEYFKEVESIIERIAQQDPGDQWKKAIEFRHPSWYIGETYEMLDEYNASLVLHDIPKSMILENKTKAGFVYMRFHGVKGDYRDSYTDGFLKEKASQVKGWLKEGKDVYAYFNNTIGNAYANAHTLKKMLE